VYGPITCSGSLYLSLVLSRPYRVSLTHSAGLSNANDILLASPADLSKKLRNHTAANIASIISSIAKAIVPAVHRASDFRVVQEGDGEDTGTEPERSAGTLSHVGNRDKGKGKGKAREGLYGEGVIGTGDAGLDRALGGGLRLGTMAEISGER
jgi:hypothetical protein